MINLHEGQNVVASDYIESSLVSYNNTSSNKSVNTEQFIKGLRTLGKVKMDSNSQCSDIQNVSGPTPESSNFEVSLILPEYNYHRN